MNAKKFLNSEYTFLNFFKIAIVAFTLIVPFFASAATEFVSVIDPGSGTGYDYSSLNSWEAAIDSDLTAAGTRVFGGSPTGAIADSVSTIYLCHGGVYQNVTADPLHETATQLMVQSLSGSYTSVSGDIWYTNNTCNSADYFTISDGGDSVIAVAKCRTTTGAADAITSTVTITGWTTSATNYIKIWTDPSENYRHSGKWDDSKYRLSLTASSGAQRAISVAEEYVFIIGLQVDIITNGYTTTTCVGVATSSSTGNTTIDSSVFRLTTDATGTNGYFTDNTATSVPLIVRNSLGIVTGSGGTSARGFLSRSSGSIFQNLTAILNASSNTSSRGYWSYTANYVTATNCVIRGFADGFYGTFNSASDYNSSSVSGDAPNTGGSGNNNTLSPWYNGATSDANIFTDASNYNLHLKGSGTIFDSVGANLYSTFTNDIDNQTRPNASFDLGADEYYDTDSPTPNPMTFVSVPDNDSSSQISMTATTGSDATTPVEYLFTNSNSSCNSDAGTGGTSSSWQTSTSYSDSGLDANKCYGYTVTARDSASTPNVGTASSVSSVYTSANTPGAPTLNNATQTTLNLTNDANGNPSSDPTTNFAVQISYTNPSDSVWFEKWINASGEPVDSEVWLSDSQLDALVLGSGSTALTSGTTYGVKVKARNQNSDETSLSSEGQGTTSSSGGSLIFDFVDSSGNSVTDPSVNFESQYFDWSAQQSTGTLGIAEEKLRVSNSTGLPEWTLEIAADSGPTALWTDGGNSYDFNDSASSGRLQVDASVGNVTAKSGCDNTGISKGAATYFSQGITDSITILSADSSAGTGSCYWDLTGVDMDQDVPASQSIGSYSLTMTLTAS